VHFWAHADGPALTFFLFKPRLANPAIGKAIGAIIAAALPPEGAAGASDVVDGVVVVVVVVGGGAGVPVGVPASTWVTIPK